MPNSFYFFFFEGSVYLCYFWRRSFDGFCAAFSWHVWILTIWPLAIVSLVRRASQIPVCPFPRALLHEKQQRNTLPRNSLDSLVFTDKAIRDGECNTREHAGHYTLCYTHTARHQCAWHFHQIFSLLILPVAKATFFFVEHCSRSHFLLYLFLSLIGTFYYPLLFPP